jgi:hypothetical protein
VTEPGWERTQFWCTVISAYLQGEMSRADVRDAYEYRDGVQLTASVAGTIRPQESQPGWQAVSFNLTPAEARQLAAQLVAAADSHDGIDDSHILTYKVEKIAEQLGLDLYKR